MHARHKTSQRRNSEVGGKGTGRQSQTRAYLHSWIDTEHGGQALISRKQLSQWKSCHPKYCHHSGVIYRHRELFPFTASFVLSTYSHSPDFLIFQYISVIFLAYCNQCIVQIQNYIAGSSYNLVNKEASRGAEREEHHATEATGQERMENCN